eukprot:CAMPEP_0113574572 /NCGR_PEP_ID=MMETSP0015_2-20120614/27218_1 /TAXON_ID=2838 /ORGANISM="Odontella" /LENGTH=340 /DNA_ID=CAMNT_0000477717 /DNA_START=57 /DNA_END=1079 /DNA_ORIENTATION=+ /assembly_acc=CAM_ASM_000160
MTNSPPAAVVPRSLLLLPFLLLSASFPGAFSFVVRMSPFSAPPLSAAAAAKSASALSSSSTSSISIASSCAVVSDPPLTTAASGVLFDVDGTLADSWRLGYEATVTVLRNNDLGHVDMNEDIYHSHCVYATPERLARHAGLVPGDDDFENAGMELGRQFDEHYVALVSRRTAGFYDGVEDILRNLPGDVKLGALTNACAAYGHAVLEANCPVKSSEGGEGAAAGDDDDEKEGAAGDDDDATDAMFALYDRFGTVHGADTVPAPKPSSSGLLQCASELDLDPRTCVYVGDAPGDGRAARAAGMMSVGVLWGSNSEEKMRDAEAFDYLCRTVEELRMLLPQK